MASGEDDSVDRRNVLRQVSGAAVGTSILGVSISRRVAAGNESDDGDGSDPTTDDGPTRPDPGDGGGSIRIPDEHWDTAEERFTQGTTASSPNPGEVPFNTTAYATSEKRVRVTTNSTLSWEKPCDAAPYLHMVETTITTETYVQNINGGTWMPMNEYNSWIGFDPGTFCYWAGGDGLPCKKIDCVDLDPGDYRIDLDPFYTQLAGASEEFVDYLQEYGNLSKTNIGTAAGVVVIGIVAVTISRGQEIDYPSAS